MVVDVPGGGKTKGLTREERGDDVVAVHHRRREVFVQNGEGWLNCYRSSPATQISFTLQHPPPILSQRSLFPSPLATPPTVAAAATTTTLPRPPPPPHIAVDALREYALSV